MGSLSVEVRTEVLCGRICDLEAENSKLRELVKDMWPHVRHRSRMCGECDLPCDTGDECLLYEPMRQRMRELGIEVDDG
ncbi:MAG: hypothetical protein IJ092_10220 [Atopobiaceae bacterium]|nr:hypothetical protein [Atopobiaceae bacterium]